MHTCRLRGIVQICFLVFNELSVMILNFLNFIESENSHSLSFGVSSILSVCLLDLCTLLPCFFNLFDFIKKQLQSVS